METGSKQNESDCVPNEFDNVCIEASVPNIYWSKDLVDLYNDYMKLVGSDDWRKYPSYFNSKREERLITRCLPPTGKMLEYALFLNVKEKTMHGIVQFGPWLEGPTTLVHGGVIATFLDMIMGVLAEELGYLALTMNLSVDYLKPLPLRTVAVAEAKLDKVDGKKVYLSAMLRSADGKIVYDKCTTLFYTVSSNESEVYRTERK